MDNSRAKALLSHSRYYPLSGERLQLVDARYRDNQAAGMVELCCVYHLQRWRSAFAWVERHGLQDGELYANGVETLATS